MITQLTDEDVAGLVERLNGRVRIGGQLLNPDGPEAAKAIAALSGVVS